MLPTLWPGDVLTVQSVRPEQVEPGEIVLYMRQKCFFIHRTVSRDLTRNKTFLVTRGDCMFEDDPPIGGGELLGKIIEVRRAGSIFMPARRLSLSRLRRLLLASWQRAESAFRRASLG